MPELSLALSRVGDMFKFGRSTRMYILGGPAELMPEEGLTKKHMQAMKALEASPMHLLPMLCFCDSQLEPYARRVSWISNALLVVQWYLPVFCSSTGLSSSS